MYGCVFGLVFIAVLLFGLHYVGFVGYIALVVVASLYYGGIGLLVALITRRGYGSPLVIATVWVVLEGLLVRWPLGGLAASEAGVALHGVGSARALASGSGVEARVVARWLQLDH